MRHDPNDFNHKSLGPTWTILNLHLTTWNKRWVLDKPHSVLAGFQFGLVSLIQVLARTILVKAEIYSALYSSLKASVGFGDDNAI